jgi:hypothetical protein
VNRRGVSLVELIIYCGIAGWIGISMVRYMGLPSYLNGLMRTVSNDQAGYASTAAPIDDLKCSLSSSIQWNLIDPTQPNPPYNPTLNPQFIPWFQINDPAITPPALPISYVCYKYRASDSALVREFISGGPPTASPITACAPVTADHAVEKVIAKGILTPTAAAPLFGKDQASTNMVVMTLRIPGTGTAAVTVVRRVHIRS